MEKISNFKSSKIWSETYGLPLNMDRNNPHLYLAYALKLINPSEGIYEKAFFDLASEFCWKCYDVDSGFYWRWPTRLGGVTSHDELIGISYYAPTGHPRQIDISLKKKGGYYNNETPNAQDILSFFRYNLHRFPWAIAFIKMRANGRVSLFHSISWSFHSILTSFKSPKSAGSHLMVWLMSDSMSNNDGLCDVALWISNLVKKVSGRNYSLENLFKIYFPDFPQYAALAKEFDHGRESTPV